MSGRSTPEQFGPEVEEAGLLSGLPKVPAWYVPVLLPLRSPNIVLLSLSTPVPLYPRILRATLYGIQVFVSFFLMLVFMTYNVRPFCSTFRSRQLTLSRRISSLLSCLVPASVTLYMVLG